jgi:hypothetical protein
MFSNRETKHGVHHESILELLFFIIHINDLPPATNNSPKPVIFSDDTSVIIYSTHLAEFCTMPNIIHSYMSKGITATKMALNLEKFVTKNLPQHSFSTVYNGKYIDETVNIKFLDLQSDNFLNWTNHIDKLKPKLSGACYAIISISATLTLPYQLIVPVFILK